MRAGAAVCAVAAVLLVGAVTRHPQLGHFGGVTDEYFALGIQLRGWGTLGLSPTEPSALRPPGYPAFVAAVLWLALPPPDRVDATAYTVGGHLAVGIAQALVLAAAAGLLTAWLWQRIDPVLAVLAGLLLGTCPVTVVMAGLLHYSPLHLASMVTGTVALDHALRRASRAAWLGAGVAWGLSALVRPITLPLPMLVFVARWATGRGLRRSAREAVLLALGIGVVVCPWMVRNWAINGRIVPVADNTWGPMWAQTARPLHRDPNRYVWFDLFRDDVMPLFTKATGAPAYSYAVHIRNIGVLEETFRHAAIANLRRHPATYAGNVLDSVRTVLVSPSPVLLAAYREIARPDAGLARHLGTVVVPQSWLMAGEPQPLLPAAACWSFAVFVYAVATLGAFGVFVSLRRRDATAVALLAAGACAVAAHVFVFSHIMHGYVRWPFEMAFAAVALDALPDRRVARALLGTLAALGLALTGWVLS